jgi:hypothetical protein
MGRRQRVVACAAVFVLACLAAALCRELETREGLPRGSLVSAVGLAPAVFVTLLVSGTFLIGQLIGYRRKRLWITTVLLLTFLALQVLTWQRASNLEHAMLQEQIVGDPDNPNPLPPSSPVSVDAYVLVLYTLGLLCASSALLTMRRLVRWHMPSTAPGKHHRHGRADGAASAAAAATTTVDLPPPPDDLFAGAKMEPAISADAAALDAPPAPPEKPVPPPAESPPARKPSQRLFE